MAATTLDYGRPEPRRLWRWWFGYVLVAAGLLLVAAVMLPSKTVVTQIDAVTGTIARRTHWPLGITTGPRVRATALEGRLRSAGVAWTPAWQFLGDREQSWFGATVTRGCASAPPVYTLGAFRRAEYWDALTDAGLRGLVFVLQTGTEDEQLAAAAERIWAAVDSDSER